MDFGDTATPGFELVQPFPALDWQASDADGTACAPLDGQLPEFTKPEFQADAASTFEDPLALLQGGWVPSEELDGTVPTGDSESPAGDPLTGECPELFSCWFDIPPHEVAWLPLDDLGIGLAEDTSEAWKEDPTYADQVSDPALLPTPDESPSPLDGTGDLAQSGDVMFCHSVLVDPLPYFWNEDGSGFIAPGSDSLGDGSEADASDPTTNENVLTDDPWTGQECIPFELPEPSICYQPFSEECYLPIDPSIDPIVDGGSEEPLPYWRGGDSQMGAPLPYWRTVIGAEQDDTGEPVLYALDAVVEPELFPDPQACYFEECYLPIDPSIDPIVDGGSEKPLPYWRGGDSQMGAPMPYWRTVIGAEQDDTGEPVLYALDAVVEPELFSDPQVCYFSVGAQVGSLPDGASGADVLLTTDRPATSSPSLQEPAAELPTAAVPEPAADRLESPVDAETDGDSLALLLDLSQSGSTGVDAPQAWRDLDPAALVTSR